jgi:hypothetical protein
VYYGIRHSTHQACQAYRERPGRTPFTVDGTVRDKQLSKTID